MFFYVLFAILIAKAVEPFSSCDRRTLNAAQSTFNILSNEIINLDRKVQDTCKQFPTITAREVFHVNSFRLEVTLPGYEYATFEMKVKHRVIYIIGHYPRTGQTCDLTYVDIKVLPDFVNPHSGAWIYRNSQLVVAFDYSYDIKENDGGCSNLYIDETLIYLRRGDPEERMFSNIYVPH